MARALLAILVTFTLGALASSFLEAGAGLPAHLVEEAIRQKLFWESPDYVRVVAMGWYPALPSWIAVPLMPLTGSESLSVFMAALGFSLIVLGLFLVYKLVLQQETRTPVALSILIILAVAHLYLGARFGSLYATSLFALVAAAVGASARIASRADLASVSLLSLSLALLSMHSIEGAVIAAVVLAIVGFRLGAKSQMSARNGVYALFLFASLLAGLLCIVYLQAFFGTGLAAHHREYVLELSHRMITPHVTLVLGDSSLTSLLGVVVLAVLLGVAHWRTGLVRCCASCGAILLVTFWTLPNPNHVMTATASPLPETISAGAVAPHVTILTEIDTVSPDFAFSRDLGDFDFPHNRAFRSTQVGLIRPNTFVLRHRNPDLQVRHRRLSAILTRFPSTLIEQTGDWELYELMPKEDP